MSGYYSNDYELLIKTKTKDEIKKELITAINNVILELNVAHENYDNATGELIDYYSYRIKASQSQYNYLIRLAKEMNFSSLEKII